jgi:mannose-6-phosphate isomerase-like protein (cupin superfamily)
MNSILTFFNNNTIRILTHGRETENALTVIDYVENPNGNPPPFTRHDFVEVFTVLEGRLAFQFLDEAVFHVLPGEAVTVASGLSHSFWNPDQIPMHVIIACSPAGLENFFQEVHAVLGNVKKGGVAEDEKNQLIDAIREKYGIEITADPPDIR